MNRQEIKYIAYSALFAIVWFMFLLPKAVVYFDGDSPLTQFFIFSIGIYLFLFIFLKAVTTGRSQNITGSFGLISMFLALDIFMPEYHVLFDGTLVQGATLGISTPDYAVGYIAQTLGLTGSMVFIFTYLIAPVILLFIAAKTLPNFVKNI